jgi:Ni,Fe-hydrogenase I small subunit
MPSPTASFDRSTTVVIVVAVGTCSTYCGATVIVDVNPTVTETDERNNTADWSAVG